jgi:hypothetical protein
MRSTQRRDRGPVFRGGGLNWYAYADGNPISNLDPFGLWTWSEAGTMAVHFGEGVVVGAAVTAAVIVAAPVVVSGLVAVGVSATIAGGAVTTAIGVGAVIGTSRVAGDIVGSAEGGNWNQVAYDAGTLAGGFAVGAGGNPSGGRAMAEGKMGKPSPAPNTWNPITILQYEQSARYQSDYPDGNLGTWMASARTPASGGASATGIAAGVGTLIQPPSTTDWFGKPVSTGPPGK